VRGKRICARPVLSCTSRRAATRRRQMAESVSARASCPGGGVGSAEGFGGSPRADRPARTAAGRLGRAPARPGCRAPVPRAGQRCGGVGPLALSQSPHERQPDCLTTPVGMGLAVDVLITVAGSFAVGRRTITREWAPAHPGLVLWVSIPTARRWRRCRRWSVARMGPTGLVVVLELLGCSFLFERPAGFLAAGSAG
jgi:hypothetical protein